MELALRERDERTQMAIESANIGTFDFNPVTGLRAWSERAKVMWGLEPDADVNEIRYFERMPPDDRQRAQEAVARARPTG